MRLHPTEQTVKKLFALSGNECAFKDCKTPMVDENGTLIGQICHIEAANEGGERYNPDQTDKERRSFENLVLLCPTHHVTTNNESVYSVGVMKDMKSVHEASFKTSGYEIPVGLLETLMKELEVGQANSIYGDNGTQAITKTGDVHVHNHFGMTREETMGLFQELFAKNKTDLVATAEATAKENVEKLGKEFFKEAEEKLGKDDLEKFSTPDVQVMMNMAANVASRKNSEVLRKNLSSLLIARIKNDSDELKSIVYNEAISTVGKLTNNQLKILAVIFILLYTSNPSVKNWETFDKYIDGDLKPFMDFKSTRTDFQHLVYAGCGSLAAIGEINLGDVLLHTYPFLFAKMIPSEAVDKLDLGDAKKSLFEFVEEDGNGFYVPKMTIMLENLEENLIKNAGVRPDVSKEVVSIYKNNLKGRGEVEFDLKNKTKLGSQLVDIVNNKNIRRFTLTSVGMVVAATYCERVIGVSLNIDIWLKK